MAYYYYYLLLLLLLLLLFIIIIIIIYYYYYYICREGRIMGIMEVSRSIGDGRFKGCGLVATPHISRCELTEKDL